MRLRLALALLFTFLALPLRAAEIVRSFQAEIEVARTGKVLVTETIDIVSEGRQFRRGIYRDIPLSYMTEGGMAPVVLKVLKVERDGAPEGHLRSFQAGGNRVYFGSEDVALPPGKHSYRWTYEIDHQISPAGTDDMFAWNVTGRWDFTIEKASATVKLPNGVKILATEQHAGTPDTPGDNVTMTTHGGALTFTAIRALEPDEQLQFKIKIPRDAIEHPPAKN
ncbi:MAG: hypothetical protein JWL86_2653 [Rhizobium sp.]|nr:hypothetical protein [Rhizobium sp.]